jgi:hypothetical protein
MAGLSDFPMSGVLRAESFDRASRFYTEVLGLGEGVSTGPGGAMFTAGSGSMVMIYERPGMPETVENNSLPDEMTVIYETHGVWNRSANSFIAETPDATRWVSENVFRFTGLRKALGLLESSFKKGSLDTMELFKAFAEKT